MVGLGVVWWVVCIGFFFLGESFFSVVFVIGVLFNIKKGFVNRFLYMDVEVSGWIVLVMGRDKVEEGFKWFLYDRRVEFDMLDEFYEIWDLFIE